MYIIEGPAGYLRKFEIYREVCVDDQWDYHPYWVKEKNRAIPLPNNIAQNLLVLLFTINPDVYKEYRVVPLGG